MRSRLAHSRGEYALPVGRLLILYPSNLQDYFFILQRANEAKEGTWSKTGNTVTKLNRLRQHIGEMSFAFVIP